MVNSSSTILEYLYWDQGVVIDYNNSLLGQCYVVPLNLTINSLLAHRLLRIVFSVRCPVCDDDVELMNIKRFENVFNLQSLHII